MPIEVKKSQIPAGFNFKDAVIAHADEWTEWLRHDHLVKEGKADAYPPPVARPLIDAAVRRNDDNTVTPDYVIVDDGPTPEQILRTKKNALLAEVGRMEQSAIDAIIPIGKRRLRDMTYNNIMNVAATRSQQEYGALNALQRAVQSRLPPAGAFPRPRANFRAY